MGRLGEAGYHASFVYTLKRLMLNVLELEFVSLSAFIRLGWTVSLWKRSSGLERAGEQGAFQPL